MTARPSDHTMMRLSLNLLAAVSGCGSHPPADPPPLFGTPPGRDALVDYEPAWSPDGTHLALISNRHGPLKVFIGHRDSLMPRQISGGEAEDDSPSWSPDGTRLAFVSSRDGNPEIYRINADGTRLMRLTHDPGMDIHPVWAPDGRSIVWNSSRHSRDSTTPETFEVFAMTPDGDSLRQLTHGGIATYASWSPDGTTLLYRRQVSNRDSDIFVTTAAGGERNVTRNPAFDGWPSWAPDGKRIVFAR